MSSEANENTTPTTPEADGSSPSGHSPSDQLDQSAGAERAARRRRRVWQVFAVVGCLLLLAGGLVVGTQSDQDERNFRTVNGLRTVKSGPNNDQPVNLDTSLYLPDGVDATNPAPAVMLAHGMGGTKTSQQNRAHELANAGYVVLTWTARGFGRSTGQIHLDHPDYEVKDARRLVDWLGQRPEVRKDGPNDPRVGAMGGSYGGALTLLLAAYDDRLDAIVPQVTWNDLGRALFPEASGHGMDQGVFKRGWAGALFTTGISADRKPERLAPIRAQAAAGARGPIAMAAGEQKQQPRRPSVLVRDPKCGKFAPDLCKAYRQAATSGKANGELLRLLRQSSPASVIDKIDVPTFMIQGLGDTLFTTAESDANARGIAANGAPVKTTWYAGGHDVGNGSDTEREQMTQQVHVWFDHYLHDKGERPDKSFSFSRVTGQTLDSKGEPDLSTMTYVAPKYPGLDGNRTATGVRLRGGADQIANPPGGNPSAVTTLPGQGALASLVGSAGERLQRIPGQTVRFESDALGDSVSLTGESKLRLRVASSTGKAVLFVRLHDVDSTGSTELLGGQVAPIRLSGLPKSYANAEPVEVTLPPLVHRFAEDHRIRVSVSATDQAYASPREPATYTVGMAENDELRMPGVSTQAQVEPTGMWVWLVSGLVGAIGIGVLGAWLWARRRAKRREYTVVPEYADTPLVAHSLVKRYSGGHLAVKGVALTVRRGEVVGLLGPNGAGKTTTLRMLLGLTRPSQGELLVFGHKVTPGAPVLSRIGALVEGPGLLPHLSGRTNLELFWTATGRPWADARVEEVLEIAGLGAAIDRKVATYSHGMKQRLAIAQAMLGLPDLLVLDEPTDGLDPPQIAEMRQVLHDYAADGRAVLISSHLLAEVEQTCTHVLVMHQGERVAAGPVREIAGTSSTVLLDVTDVDRAEQVLREMPGIRGVERNDDTLVVDLNGTPRPELIAALVDQDIGVERMESRRRLEEAFLTLVGDGAAPTVESSGERKDADVGHA